MSNTPGENLLMKYYKNKETYENAPFDGDDYIVAMTEEQKKRQKLIWLISVAINLILGIWSAILSWNCNTKMGTHTALKLLYAILAFMFGFFYLLFYALFRLPFCNQI